MAAKKQSSPELAKAALNSLSENHSQGASALHAEAICSQNKSAAIITLTSLARNAPLCHPMVDDEMFDNHLPVFAICVFGTICFVGCDRHGTSTVTIETKFGLRQAEWIPIDVSAIAEAAHAENRTGGEWDKEQCLKVNGPIQIVILPQLKETSDTSSAALKLQLEQCKSTIARLEAENQTLRDEADRRR